MKTGVNFAKKFGLIELLISGFIGIGITMTFWFLQNDYPDNVLQFLWDLGFGFLVGLTISFGIRNVFVWTIKWIPKSHFKYWIILLLSFTVSYLIFTLFQTLFLCSAKTSATITQNSLGTATLSTIIAMFCIFIKEIEDKLQLEQNSKKLAVIEERNRLARELHDSVSQNLFGISLNLNIIKQLIPVHPEKTMTMVDQLQEMVEEIQAEMRLMIYELQPAALLEKGFFEAIESLIELFRVRYRLEISYRLDGEGDSLNSPEQLTIYRVIQESLNNIIKHAHADKVELFLKLHNGHGELLIHDNGKGFDITKAIDDGHFGIQGMIERFETIKGKISFDSKQGEGTSVKATF